MNLLRKAVKDQCRESTNVSTIKMPKKRSSSNERERKKAYRQKMKLLSAQAENAEHKPRKDEWEESKTSMSKLEPARLLNKDRKRQLH